VDAEGSFIIKSTDRTLGWKVQAIFAIKLLAPLPSLRSTEGKNY